jgi:hypothetical protein
MDLSDARPVTSDEGVTFTPWTDGWAVGFRITREQDDRVEYLVLNPSGGSDPGEAGRGDVFLYHADDTDDPVGDGSPVVYVDVMDPERGAVMRA